MTYGKRTVEAIDATPPPSILRDSWGRDTWGPRREINREKSRSVSAQLTASKFCPNCRRALPIGSFMRNKTLPGGRSGWCAACQAKATGRWRAANPEYVAAYNIARRAPLIDKVCICGRTFQTSRRSTRYCELHRGDRGPGRATRYLGHRLRRARLGAPQRAIRLADVYARDAGVCWICEQPVDRDLLHPDPMSASLDHVLPLKHGGRHELENVRLAHLRCNVRRGAPR